MRKGTPRPIIEKLAAAFKKPMPTPTFTRGSCTEEAKKIFVPAMEKAVRNTKSKVEEMWGVIQYKSPSEQRKMWEEEYQKIYEIAAKIGFRK